MIKESILSLLAQIQEPEQSNIVWWPYDNLVILPGEIDMHQLIRSPYSKSLGVIHQRHPTKKWLFATPPTWPTLFVLKTPLPPLFMDVQIARKRPKCEIFCVLRPSMDWAKGSSKCNICGPPVHALIPRPPPSVHDRPHLLTPPHTSIWPDIFDGRPLWPKY